MRQFSQFFSIAHHSAVYGVGPDTHERIASSIIDTAASTVQLAISTTAALVSPDTAIANATIIESIVFDTLVI